jgi:hypothetical protein
MAGRLLGILGHQALELGLGLLVVEMRLVGLREDRGELRPSVRRSHVDNPHGLKPRLGRLDPKQLGLFAALDTAPEFTFGGDNQMLVQRIGVRQNLNPFAAAGNHREHRSPRRHHPHVVLELRHVFLGGGLLRE